MDYIAQGFLQAIQLLLIGNPETYTAVFTTLKVSSLSIMASLIIGIPLGFLLGYFTFPGKRQMRATVDTLLALPTVVELGLLFALPGIALAQTILITPIVISLTASAIESLDKLLRPTLLSLGARRQQILFTSLLEARYGILTAAVTAYGRAISEVGISMMIGGNIKWHTRTITTAIALETGKGEFAVGMALGIVLLTLAFAVNLSLTILKRRS